MRFGIVTIVCVALIASMASFAGAELITGNLLVRLETVGTSPVTTVGTAVTSWNDQAALGGAENFTDQGTASYRPTLVSGATPLGKAAIDFDGINDYLTHLGRDTDFEGATYTWFSVFRMTKIVSQRPYSATTGNLLSNKAGSTSKHWGSWVHKGGTANSLARNSDESTYAIISTPFADDDLEWHILYGVWNGSGAVLNGHAAGTITGWLDDTSMGTGTGVSGAPASPHTMISVGWGNSATSTYLQGQAAATLIYNTALSASDIAAVKTYLSGTYLVPEPSTLALLATGLIGLLAYAWRKRK